MSSLAAMTLPLSVAFISVLLLAPGGIGAADRFGRNRGDLAGLERDLPGAPDIGPPLLVLLAFRLAHEVQRLVLAEHAGDRELHIGLRLRHDQSVGNNVGRGLGLRSLFQLTTRED